MTKIVLRWILAKTFRLTYETITSYILGYERFTFRISRKIPWKLLNGCQPIFKILQENIFKP